MLFSTTKGLASFKPFLQRTASMVKTVRSGNFEKSASITVPILTVRNLPGIEDISFKNMFRNFNWKNLGSSADLEKLFLILKFFSEVLAIMI